MADETDSPERRIYDTADVLLLETGSLDAVTLENVIQRAGGRRQNVSRVLNRWREDRRMMAAYLPDAVLRAARNAARDMWLIIQLTAVPHAGTRPEPLPPDEGRPSNLLRSAPPFPGSRGGPRRSEGRRKDPPSSTAGHSPAPTKRPRRYSSLPPQLPEPRRPAGFGEGRARRKADRQAASKASRAALRSTSSEAQPPKKPRTRRLPANKRSRPPETTAEREARLARMRALVERERPRQPPKVVTDEDWKGAARPDVARAVARELRAHGRPMQGQVLVDTGRIHLTTKRAHRHLPPALAGSRIVPGRGGYWFEYEERPSGRRVLPAEESDYKIIRYVGEILWRKVLLYLGAAPKPPGHAEIRAHLGTILSDMNPEWLGQQLKRARKQRLVKASKGGFALTKPIHLYD